MQRWWNVCRLLAVCMICLPGCMNESLVEEDLPLRTVLVYIGGDNDLSGETAWRVETLCEGWKNKPDGRLLIYVDKAGEPPCLMEMRRGGGCGEPYWDIIESYEEKNSADAEVLGEIVGKLPQYAPARSYGLVVFSHGSGWLPATGYTSPRSLDMRSLIKDGEEEMNIEAFAAALPDAMFDFIVLEACFMGSVEVAYELRTKAKELLFSAGEIFSPGFTEVYPTQLYRLFQPQADLAGFARSWFETVNAKNGLLRSATVCVIRTDGLEGLADAIAPAGLLEWSGALGGVQGFDRDDRAFFFDLADAYRRSVPGERWTAISRELEKVVVYADATPSLVNLPIRTHCGLSVYITGRYEWLDARYRTMAWFKRITDIN